MNNDLNNKMNFDPMTGEPINNIRDNENYDQAIIQINNAVGEQINLNEQFKQTINEEIKQQPIDELNEIQNKMQSIPTVEQSNQDFINNVQTTNKQKNEEKKESNGIIFFIVAVVLLLLAIYFLFPLLMKYI